jgi:hypothetical protein
MVLAGSIGLGAVWGWFLGLWTRPSPQNPLRHYALIFLSTVAISALVYYFTSLPVLIPYAVALMIAFGLHRAWQEKAAAAAAINPLS